MVFLGNFPVQFSAESGVIGKSQVLLKVNHSALGGALKISRRAGVKPESADTDFVRVKIIWVGGVQIRSKRENSQKSDSQECAMATNVQLSTCHVSSVQRRSECAPRPSDRHRKRRDVPA